MQIFQKFVIFWRMYGLEELKTSEMWVLGKGH